MLKNLISAFLVFRLECRQLAVDLDLVLALWRQRPTIEIVLKARQNSVARKSALRRRLDEVYPF
jgi:hypothetical protein